MPNRLSFALLAIFVLGAAQARADGFKILVTSFDPFGGSPTNNTQAIVADLAANPGSFGDGVTVETCNLPVIYDTASVDAMDCVSKYQPDAVVSLGEADCELLMETAATNLDNTPGEPDNAGQIRSGTPIVAGGPERSGFNFPVQAMYCSLDSSSPPVQVSTDPGAFVCNNTAYHLSQELTPKKIPFTFIHVPNAECSADQMDPATNAAAIAQWLRAAIANLRSPLSTISPWPHPGNSKLLPTTADEAQSLLQEARSEPAPACEQSFAQAIISAY